MYAIYCLALYGSPLMYYPVPSGSAVAGQNNTYLPHKGVIDLTARILYVSYSNGAGPYDGSQGMSDFPLFTHNSKQESQVP